MRVKEYSSYQKASMPVLPTRKGTPPSRRTRAKRPGRNRPAKGYNPITKEWERG
jgi:hypothetical protein